MNLANIIDPAPTCLACPQLRAVRAHKGTQVRVICDNPECELPKEVQCSHTN